MRRMASLALSMLAVMLLVVRCADGDTSEERQEPQTGGMTAASTGDADPPNGAVRESAQRSDQTDGILQAQPVNPEPVPARLGDRFEWCADIQRAWDRQAQAQAHVDAEIAAWRDAVEAYEAATDELDKAEAFNLRESVEMRYRDLLPALVVANDAAARPLRPNWQGDDQTQAIAVVRAREALQQSADQALLELMEIAYSTSLQGESATAAPSAGDETRPLVPHGGVVSASTTGDEAMTLEASLTQLARLQNEVVSWSAAYWKAIQEMESALLDIHEAESPNDAMAAYERLLEAAPMSEEVQGAGWNASDAAEKLRRAYVLSARQALQAGTMNAEEYRNGLIDVEATVRAILERIQHIRASDNAARLIHASSMALQETANGFVLADTAAWTAFQASLSESCNTRQ